MYIFVELDGTLITFDVIATADLTRIDLTN